MCEELAFWPSTGTNKGATLEADQRWIESSHYLLCVKHSVSTTAHFRLPLLALSNVRLDWSERFVAYIDKFWRSQENRWPFERTIFWHIQLCLRRRPINRLVWNRERRSPRMHNCLGFVSSANALAAPTNGALRITRRYRGQRSIHWFGLCGRCGSYSWDCRSARVDTGGHATENSPTGCRNQLVKDKN